MNVAQLEIPKEEAEKQYQEYREALNVPKFQHEQYLKDLKKVYGHMRHGRSIIDLWASMKKAGLRADNTPKLAICRADSKRVRFRKVKDEGGIFYYALNHLRHSWDNPWHEDIKIPEGTFRHWEETSQTQRYRADDGTIKTWERKEIREQELETIVPIIPAEHINTLRGNLKNYHILWEVKKWKPVPPVDPILLRQVTANMFVVLASWDLTPVERAVIKGRLQ